MNSLNDLIDKCVIEKPFPHINQCELENSNIKDDFNSLVIHVFEFYDYVLDKYISKITKDTTNESIKNIFMEIRSDLCNKLIFENKEITESSYIKLINLLIYNCYMH